MLKNTFLSDLSLVSILSVDLSYVPKYLESCDSFSGKRVAGGTNVRNSAIDLSDPESDAACVTCLFSAGRKPRMG